eukprot:CAMPEP_0116062480 /NCGR_PEP_ID=MMETSP0322-20121206/7785_1 /TAXON_ID=163516 /ORGANISM="Leptocylindrus danicus var. apora, Strain B651" /LENGTH=289 /DNA_ID=CAMNT_0003547797 /DNA_START=530 /DNA_END=1399 /DNA_ORIENTATION=+
MTLAGTLSALTLQGRGDSNDDDIYAEEDVDLRWFLLQTCILIFAMVTCVRCITACIAYRDAQLYDQLMTNNANFANNGGGTNPPGRRRWIGDNPPLSEDDVDRMSTVVYSSVLKEGGAACDDAETVSTAGESKTSFDESEKSLDAVSAIASIITNCTQRQSRNYCTSCSVCLDDFEDGETVKQLHPCNHLFHEECIKPWLTQRSGNCPLCKVACMPVIEEVESSDNDQADSGASTVRSISLRRFFGNFRWTRHEGDTSADENDDLDTPLLVEQNPEPQTLRAEAEILSV